jgi:tetratricopeptide repeat protein
VAGNPRIDDLRRRLEKDPGSRLFAQLAEELRKDGDLEEAINVCREGLKRQPAYPSARMTLGRALFDTGDLAAARTEFETVLKGAPDNILASRLLAEALEGLGDLPGAAKQYKTTLALAPGDKQVQAHLDAVEKRLKGGGAAPTAAPARPPSPPASVTPATIILPPPSAPPSPASAATVRAPRPPDLAADTSPDKFPMPEPEPPPPPPVQRDYAPIPLVAADETFELEAAHESPATRVGGGAGAAGADWVVGVAMPMPPAAPPATEEPFPMPEDTLIEPPKAPPAPEEETAFELEQPYESPVTQWAMASPPPVEAPPVPEEPPPPPAAEPAMDFAEEFVPPEPAPRPPGAPLDLPPLAAEPPSPPPLPPVAAAPEPVEAPPPPPPIEVAPPPPPPAAPEPPAAEPAPPAPDLSSATLAELYFNQGFTDKALDVYRQLVEREPGNERARARITELEALDRHLRAEEARDGQGEPAAPADPAAARRKAIERTIARLEAMLAAVKKEQP